jgi:hypothetical protein
MHGGGKGDGELHTYDELEPKLKADAEQAALSVVVEDRLKKTERN